MSVVVPRKRPRARDKTKRVNAPTETPFSGIDAVQPSSAKSPKRKSRKRKKTQSLVSGVTIEAASHNHKSPLKSSWAIVHTCGGRFKPKAIFSRDERYLFAATDRVIKVLSSKSGQCVRSVGNMHKNGRIVDFSIDPFNQLRLLIAYDTSIISSYDWTDGLLITQCSTSEVPRSLIALENSALLLLSATQLLACTWPLSSQRNESPRQIETKSVLELDSSHTNHLISVDNTASTICITSGNKIRISIDRDNGTSHAQSQFAWREFTNPNQITSIACHGDIVAVGEQSGTIRIYLDITHAEKSGHLPTSTRINWHQSPVSSLQISNNGLYLLSGAADDVVMISQIGTGHRQFIPRVGAEINGISETKSGSLYSICLSNNNIKIIDAADLELVSEVSGIQSIASPTTASKDVPCIPPVALLQPRREHLYINGAGLSRGTFQGYDVWEDRQALRIDVGRITRIKSAGKEKRPVIEPVVNLAAFSNDGSWLATVDEWENHYALDEDDPTEIFLKFWAWKGKQWDVVAKVESPHGIRCRLLALASPNIQSTVQEFASLGADGSVKIWRPFSSRFGTSTEILWSHHKTVGSHSSRLQSEGALNYSADGSVLVAGISEDIFVISLPNGEVVKCLHVGDSISKLEVLGRYVLCLHKSKTLFSGWDIATGQIIFSERLDCPYSTMAVNHSCSTFAISTAATPTKSNIVISRITSNVKVDETRIPLDSIVTSLLGADFAEISGFMYVDDSGQVGCISLQNLKKGASTQDIPSSTVNVIPASVRQELVGKNSGWAGQIDGMSTQTIHDIVEADGDIDVVQMYEKIVQNL